MAGHHRDKKGKRYQSHIDWCEKQRKEYQNVRGVNGEKKFTVKCPFCGESRPYHFDVKYKYCDKWDCQTAAHSEPDYDIVS